MQKIRVNRLPLQVTHFYVVLYGEPQGKWASGPSRALCKANRKVDLEAAELARFSMQENKNELLFEKLIN